MEDVHPASFLLHAVTSAKWRPNAEETAQEQEPEEDGRGLNRDKDKQDHPYLDGIWRDAFHDPISDNWEYSGSETD